VYQLACYEGGRDYVLFLVGGSPPIEPSLAQNPVNDSQEPTGGGHLGRVGTLSDPDTLVVSTKFRIAPNCCLASGLLAAMFGRHCGTVIDANWLRSDREICKTESH